MPRRTIQILWPNNIQYIEAICELDLMWKDSRYSGTMSLILDYPDKLLIDVYGPFGDTVVHIQKDIEKFIMTTKEGSVYNEAKFESDFGIKLTEFIDDLARKNHNITNDAKIDNNERKRYKVRYDLEDGNNKICWEMKDGDMCITFLDVKFSKQ